MIHYQGRWAVVTGASSGLGRGLAARLADRGMSLVLTGRNEARLNETAQEIRRAAPEVEVETVVADLSTRSGISALLRHIGDRPIEVLVNNAGFGSYGPFAEADPERGTNEVAVDVGAVILLARAFLPGMLARRSGGILNVASAIAFQPAPYQAVYGASKALVLSFSQALWAEARASGVAVTALCPGPTRTGFVDALDADVGHTAIYRRLADPEPVIDAGLRGLDKGRAVVIPGLRNKLIATGGRFMPREWLARVSARLLGPTSTAPRPPIEVHNETVVRASPERVWDLLNDVASWPSWHRACRWVHVDSADGATRPTSFRWKAHPVALRSTVVAADRPRTFTFTADARGLHAEHSFTLRPTPDGRSTVVVSHETQVGPLPQLGRAALSRRLDAANQAWLADLARTAGDGAAAAR
ncbi:SDR family NAD(P)-dependent oxidoreductase [Sandaracinus amylolyticus]|uniref:SDR family NAD(P)-dependent oxidoreductase n=1 Tax=Sandaracinus amylolyticus TaxID=927083 RepID=UPI001F172AD1|nr:SDR family NAD(P)-dependent oxidoreductase [Sandaracinus amylolyticus]UJR82070.1 Short-chain dehydrogenase [Sandaracinus amylolyticus]